MGKLNFEMKDIMINKISDGYIACPQNQEIVLCKHIISPQQHLRIIYIALDTQIPSDITSFEFYFKIDGKRSIEGFQSLKLPIFPVGNDKTLHIFLESPGAIVELVCINTDVATRNAFGHFYGWEYNPFEERD